VLATNDFLEAGHLARLLHRLCWNSLFSKAPLVASHLTIISGTNAGANARPFNGAKSDADTNAAPGLFAALLDTKPAETKAASGMGETGESELARLVRLGLATASGEKGEETADAIAAALDLKGLDALPVDPAPMVDFVEALRALKSSLDNGEPLDPDLLAKADAALTRLAEALGLDLETLPVPLDFAALLDAEGASGTGLGAALNEMLSPLAQSLAAAQAPESARAIAGEASAKDQLKALGDKLAALLGALEDGAVGEDKLAAIGMKPGAAPADEITLAMARFAAGADAEAQVPEEPVLAAPSLKVKETSLTGEAAKPASSGEPVRADNASTRDDTGSDMPGAIPALPRPPRRRHKLPRTQRHRLPPRRPHRHRRTRRQSAWKPAVCASCNRATRPASSSSTCPRSPSNCPARSRTAIRASRSGSIHPNWARSMCGSTSTRAGRSMPG